MGIRETGPIPDRQATAKPKRGVVISLDPARRRTPSPAAAWKIPSPRIGRITPIDSTRLRRAAGDIRLVLEQYRGLTHVAPTILRDIELIYAIISVRERLFDLGIKRTEFPYPHGPCILLDDELEQLLRRLDAAECRNTAQNIEFTTDQGYEPYPIEHTADTQRAEEARIKIFGKNINPQLLKNPGLIRRMMNTRREITQLKAASITIGLRWSDSEEMIHRLSCMIADADAVYMQNVATHMRFQTGWQPADEEFTQSFEISLGDMLGIIKRARDLTADRVSFYEEDELWKPITSSMISIRRGDGGKTISPEILEQYGYPTHRPMKLRDFLRNTFGLMVRES